MVKRKISRVTPELSLIVPTYNEIENIKGCMDRLLDVLAKNKVNYEVIIVDDDSTDGTYEYLNKLSKINKKVKVFIRKKENGFGSAIMFGLRKAKGKYLVPFMADLSDDPLDAIKIYKTISKGYDVVFTNRFKGKNRAYDYPFLKYYCNRLYNLIISLVFNLDYTDSSNAFKAIRKDIVDKVRIKNKGFEVTTELAVKSYFIGKKFTEIAVTWHNRVGGKQKSNLFKIGMGYFNVFFLLLKEKKSFVLKNVRK